jgi:hypothetical protein
MRHENSAWHRCRHWEYAFDEDRVDPDDPDRELTRDELAAVMIHERLQEEIAKLPPELRHTTPPIPADFLEMMRNV